ncbi:uncharacterized protein LOC111050591 [Nilaparvata lugens]|uniref:uncharacterized protein LOC111050591 n=1 Tax=Nilaparvata lugens TaxID=108931 RepID=UPI00193E5ACE|nr:uncharacterized protein LOC111050591 [Nilaparvata lugens]
MIKSITDDDLQGEFKFKGALLSVVGLIFTWILLGQLINLLLHFLWVVWTCLLVCAILYLPLICQKKMKTPILRYMFTSRKKIMLSSVRRARRLHAKFKEIEHDSLKDSDKVETSPPAKPKETQWIFCDTLNCFPEQTTSEAVKSLI